MVSMRRNGHQGMLVKRNNQFLYDWYLLQRKPSSLLALGPRLRPQETVER